MSLVMTPSPFTPTQQAMLDMLADGLPHSPEELCACLPDELGTRKNVRAHLSNVRKVLRLMGQDIICEFARRRTFYRHVRLLQPGNGEGERNP